MAIRFPIITHGPQPPGISRWRKMRGLKESLDPQPSTSALLFVPSFTWSGLTGQDIVMDIPCHITAKNLFLGFKRPPNQVCSGVIREILPALKRGMHRDFWVATVQFWKLCLADASEIIESWYDPIP
ncbi:MAG: hypothetical protein ACPGPS_06570 [Rubripirellula sp.]